MPESIDKRLTRAFAEHYSKAVAESFANGFNAIDYDTPDGQMLASLQKNIYHFSAAKNYTQLKQLSQALIGEDGKLRSYSQFKGAAMQINDAHVDQWLRAEYNLAVASGQMAATWVRIQESKDYLPMLEFDAVLDKRTTETCRSLDGVVKPVDDRFWATYYPPNHFGCRSDVRQHASRTATADNKIEYPEIPDMFKTNLAKRGLVFPPKHAYWKDCPEEILKAGENLIK